ncbi:hypothetical protein ANN_07647 [Periplaneta americana]|uniref:Uncharacterized protein n=1 Tax=Periplaneta americana TaxID=6978 RepID=A0ABQ8SZV0_PERAM|nr:hypothetical protein ANN_07647 [Periplaneta americana]
MAGLCEGGNEPPGFLKTISKNFNILFRMVCICQGSRQNVSFLTPEVWECVTDIIGPDMHICVCVQVAVSSRSVLVKWRSTRERNMQT